MVANPCHGNAVAMPLDGHMVAWRHGARRRGRKGDAMRRFAIALPLMLLAACGNEPEIKMENASVAEVAEEMRETKTASFVNPGKWQQTVTLREIDAPGMPAEAKQMMRRAMDARSYEVCLTPEQAKSPKEDFFTGADQNCRYDHFNWGDGKIDLKLVCKQPSATQTMAMIGSYSPEAYTMAVTSTTAGGDPAGAMVMKMKIDARRIGACDGKEGAAN